MILYQCFHDNKIDLLAFKPGLNMTCCISLENI